MAGCRPGISAPANGIQFVDVARQAGFNHVVAFEGKDPSQALTILETMGNGCAFLDYDNDGRLDVLLVDRPPLLFRGNGTGRFRDVTKAMKLDKVRGHVMGCAVGDYDNDGFADIYLSGFGTGRLFHNERGKGFRDVTTRAGLKPQPWGTSCGFADFDGDGRLDLFIVNYVEFGANYKKYLQRCEPLACGPDHYNPERPTFYRNAGNGRFTDATRDSGVLSSGGKGLALGFADFDDDGDTDVMVANDQVAGDLFLNTGGGHFANSALASGTAFGLDAKPQGGMGVDWADYDGDNRLDAIVTNYTTQPRSLYRNDGDNLFTNTTDDVGIGAATKPFLAFGVKWLDYDNDGWPDLMIANGNVDNKIAIMEPGTTFRQPMQVFRNAGAGRRPTFSDESRALGPSLPRPIVGRGLATGDFDNDGRVDALVMDDDGPVILLHNQGGVTGNWIGLSLAGTGKSNRDAMGARVTLAAGGRTQVREVHTAGSYLSASDKRLLFGIGAATKVDSVTIRWPDGQVETRSNLAPGRYHSLKQALKQGAAR